MCWYRVVQSHAEAVARCHGVGIQHKNGAPEASPTEEEDLPVLRTPYARVPQTSVIRSLYSPKALNLEDPKPDRPPNPKP